jgi:hypothetical protein
MINGLAGEPVAGAECDHCHLTGLWPVELVDKTSTSYRLEGAGRQWSRGFPGQENHSCDISTQKTHSCGFLIVLLLYISSG